MHLEQPATHVLVLLLYTKVALGCPFRFGSCKVLSSWHAWFWRSGLPSLKAMPRTVPTYVKMWGGPRPGHNQWPWLQMPTAHVAREGFRGNNRFYRISPLFCGSALFCPLSIFEASKKQNLTSLVDGQTKRPNFLSATEMVFQKRYKSSECH